MRTLLVAALVISTSCAKTDELETKVAELSKELAATKRQLDDLDDKVANTRSLERKLDDIERELAKTREMVATRPPSLPSRPARPEPDRSKTYAVPVDNAPSLGPTDAKVTIVVAHEYACPYCEKARSTLEELRKKYGKDLRIVFKQLVVHPRNATASALAICAADKQQKYVEMDRLLWDDGFNQRQLDLSDTAGAGGQKCWDTADGCPIVVGFAKKLGLSVSRFKSDMRECQQSLQQGMRELQNFAVSATPSFFINGRFMSGAMPIENFSTLIDEELAKADARIAQGTPKRRYYQQWILDEGLKTLTPP